MKEKAPYMQSQNIYQENRKEYRMPEKKNLKVDNSMSSTIELYFL